MNGVEGLGLGWASPRSVSQGGRTLRMMGLHREDDNGEDAGGKVGPISLRYRSI